MESNFSLSVIFLLCVPFFLSIQIIELNIELHIENDDGGVSGCLYVKGACCLRLVCRKLTWWFESDVEQGMLLVVFFITTREQWWLFRMYPNNLKKNDGGNGGRGVVMYD